MPEEVSLQKLISFCVFLARKASDAVSAVPFKRNGFHVWEKGLNDSVTEADFLSQQIIQNSLENAFPTLKIIGEEKISLEQRHVPPFTQNDYLLDFGGDQSEVFLDLSKTIVWIDPLDGTKQFVKGNYDAVTVLVGVSFDEEPIAGVIVHPFMAAGNSNEPVVFFGVNHRNFHCVQNNMDLRLKTSMYHREFRRRVVTSWPNWFLNKKLKGRNLMYYNYVRKCRPREVFGLCGCGRKMLSLLWDEADAYVYPIKGTKKWDTCAPQAILEAAGGMLTRPDGTRLCYSEKEVENNEGFVATLGLQHDSFLFLNKHAVRTH